MKTNSGLFLLCSMMLVVAGCGQNGQPSTYQEIFVDAPQAAAAPADPQSMLKEMLARGQDPHAFLKNAPTPAGDSELANSPSSAQAMANMISPEMLASKGSAKLLWQTPEGWTEKTGSGMRMASFKSAATPDLDVSIISLSGPAGGLLSNVNRWLQQMKVESLTESQFAAFLEKQESVPAKGGFAVRLLDLSVLQTSSDPTAPVILAGLVEFPDQTLFIKLLSNKNTLNENRAAFKALCQSLKLP